MIQCADCEYFAKGAGGRLAFKCDPFGSIKEAECLVKWQLLRTSELAQKMDRMVAAYEATLAAYKRIQPLQEKMFRHMEQEIDEQEESDAWKHDDGDDEEGEEDD